MWAATTALRQPVLQLAHRHARTTYTKPFVTSADLELDPNSLLAWPTTVNVSGFEVKIPQGIPFDKALYTFKDKKLEKQIYTHKSCGIKEAAWGAGSEVVRLDNEHLEWLGDSVLKGLTAHLIDNLYPDLNEGDTSALQSALVSNRFYCHLTRTLGIAGRLEIGGSASIQTIGTERVIGGLFEAYIGGIHRETGLGGYPTLYRWFEDLVKPYAIQFPRIIASVQPLHFKGFQDVVTFRLPQPISATRSYKTWVHEYTRMNKHPDSVYSFESLGPVHSRSYRCTVDIGTKKFVGTFDSSLAKAKELACQKLHDYLVSLSEGTKTE